MLFFKLIRTLKSSSFTRISNNQQKKFRCEFNYYETCNKDILIVLF